jgi:hypothetical protein
MATCISSISAGCSAILAKHPLKSTGREGPFVQCHASDTKWIIEVLVEPSTVTIEGDRKVVDA